LQGIRGVGGRALPPNPVDERRLRDCVTWFEREGDQQPAQPGARHVGEDAVVRANLEWSKHPDLHLADFAMGHEHASKRASRDNTLGSESELGSESFMIAKTFIRHSKGRPPSRACPRSGRSSPSSSRMVVDLPLVRHQAGWHGMSGWPALRREVPATSKDGSGLQPSDEAIGDAVSSRAPQSSTGY
jgi:hypothetical protein